MSLDFQLRIKSISNRPKKPKPMVQDEVSTPWAVGKQEEVKLTLLTTLTLIAVSVQLIPSLNKQWDRLAEPWQAFLAESLHSKKTTKYQLSSNSDTKYQLLSNSDIPVGTLIGEYPITSGFGARLSPCPGCSSYHPAFDIGTPVGTVVKAPFKTEVSCVDYGGLSGLVAEFPSPEGDYTVQLLHLNDCTEGAAQKDQPIAKTGDAGTGPHLDVRIKDKDGDRLIPSKTLLEDLLK